MMLDERSISERFREDGYAVVPGVFSQAAIDATIAAAVTLPAFKGGDHSSVMQPHRLDTSFLNITCSQVIVAIVEGLIGPAVALQTHFFYGMPGSLGFNWHQDVTAIEAPPEDFMSAWVPLVDVSEENGSLMVFPGTHKLGPLATEYLERRPSEDPFSNTLATLIPRGYEEVCIEAHAGDVVFFHGALVHGSTGNWSAKPRFAMLNTYIRQGVRFRAGAIAKREPIALS